MDINLLHILIRQMAALVRRASAEVYTVPVFLVTNVFSALGFLDDKAPYKSTYLLTHLLTY